MPMSKMDLSSQDEVEIWKLKAFDGPSQEELDRQAAADAAEEIVLPTAEELEAMQEMARQEGYHAGYREGFSEGEMQVKTLTHILENFQTELTRLDEVVAAQITALALGIARKTLGFAYKFDTQLVAKMVEHALQTLPASMEPTRVQLNPDDFSSVAHILSDEFSGRKLTFIPEQTISRGGLKLMTATTDIDGTFETRWDRVTASLDTIDWHPLPERAEILQEKESNESPTQ